jgi:peptidoglycan/xylan/chitin deacetylase (PgdA/CDA1 family)
MIYWKTANKLLRLLYPGWYWQVPTKDKKIYLTFDDGPHPRITPFVLDQLKKYNACASFFCIGKNVQKHPDIYERILTEGHSTGNHTMHHKNGWKTATNSYFSDINEAAKFIDSKLFRPPYGKLTRFQGKALNDTGWKIIMWTVLSGDFDHQLTTQECWKIITKNTGPGSIVLMHDSEKAFDRLAYILPRTLDKFSSEGFTFQSLSMDSFQHNRHQ